MNDKMHNWNIQMALKELEHDVGAGSQQLAPLGFKQEYLHPESHKPDGFDGI